jgi:hypothetical protein
LRLVKTSGITIPRSSIDSKAYFKTRDFQLLLKDKALKVLVVQLQKLQNLPVSTLPMGSLGGIMESMTIPSATLSVSKQISDALGQQSAASTPQTANASRLSKHKKSKKKE